MNKIRRIGLGLILGGSLTLSCTGPLAFQDPASARRLLGSQSHKHLGSRPVIQQDEYGLQPQANQQQLQQMQLMQMQQQAQAQNPYAQAPYAQNQQAAYQPAPNPYAPAAQQAQAPNAPLLSWNGQVAAGSGEGQTRLATGQPKHGLEPQVEGRMHILNLYQEVLDERDNLLLELKRLNSAMREGEQLLSQLRASEKEYGLRVAALEEVKRTLVDQNKDLSSRLTVAQIRRLESDKMLLESQILLHSTNQFALPKEILEPVLLTDK